MFTMNNSKTIHYSCSSNKCEVGYGGQVTNSTEMFPKDFHIFMRMMPIIADPI